MQLPELGLPGHRAGMLQAANPKWPGAVLAISLACFANLALFHADWAEMARQWWNSSTYNHILFVLPIACWLAAMRARQVAMLAPVAWWPGLVLVALSLFIWLLGTLAEVNTAKHLGLVLAVEATFLALAGPRVVAALAFPLAYLLFLVPIGGELVPPLQMVTARIAVFLVTTSGVPARIEGVFISTPAGLFEVAEACSGVSFLVAMVALGTLAAHLCFRSPWRRLAFLASAVIVPILANGIRAGGTIYLAQHYGAEAVTGFAHIAYGWVFFGVVMAALAVTAAPFFDRAPGDRFVDPDALARSSWLSAAEAWKISTGLAAAALLALALAASCWSRVTQAPPADFTGPLVLPDLPGWTQVSYGPAVAWHPHAAGARDRLLVRLRNQAGQEVDLFAARFAGEGGDGGEAGVDGEGAVPAGGGWAWVESVRATQRGRGEYLVAGSTQRVAATYYRTGTLLTGSRARLKLELMKQRLLFRSGQVTVLILSTEVSGRRPSMNSINAFAAATGPLGPWVDRMAERP